MLRAAALTAASLALAPQAIRAEAVPHAPEGLSCWGLWASGILSFQAPCPRHGIFRIDTDGIKGHALSHEDQPDPRLRGEARHLAQVRAAFAAGECLLASGRLEGDVLVIAALHGPCPLAAGTPK